MRSSSISLLLLISVALFTSCASYSAEPTSKWQLTLAVDANAQDRERVIEQAVATIHQRFDILGLPESRFEIKPDSGNGKIHITTTDQKDRERLKTIVTSPGSFEIVAVVGPPNPKPYVTYSTREEALASIGKDADKRRVLPFHEHRDTDERKWVVVESPSIIDKSDVRQAEIFSYSQSEHSVVIAFKDVGISKLGDWTRKHMNSYLGILFNDEVKSIAYVKSEFTGPAEIGGGFTKEAAEEIAIVLNSATLPPVKIVEERIQ